MRKIALVLALAIGVLGATAIVIWYDEYSRTHWVPSDKWLVGATWTLFVFGMVVWQFRRSWHSVSFWTRIVVFAAIHCVVLFAVLQMVEEWHSTVHALISFVETMVIMGILTKQDFR